MYMYVEILSSSAAAIHSTTRDIDMAISSVRLSVALSCTEVAHVMYLSLRRRYMHDA